jgi:hypothetical protein
MISEDISDRRSKQSQDDDHDNGDQDQDERIFYETLTFSFGANNMVNHLLPKL